MAGPRKKHVVIVSPALANANNGNWQTARRWQILLQSPDAGIGTSRESSVAAAVSPYTARIVTHWPDGPRAAHDDCMLALHARRSAPAILAWANRGREAESLLSAQPVQGLAVVLTGTDLYRDILTDLEAQHALRVAQHVVLLQLVSML